MATPETTSEATSTAITPDRPSLTAETDQRIIRKWNVLLEETGFDSRTAKRLVFARLLHQQGKLQKGNT